MARLERCCGPLRSKNSLKKSGKLSHEKSIEQETLKVVEKKEKKSDKDLSNIDDLTKVDDNFKKQENHNEQNIINSNEKEVIKVELNNDEKIVFSHLGINPLIKLGKEYITSNNIVQLEDIGNQGKDIQSKDEKSKKKVINSRANKIIDNKDSNQIDELDIPLKQDSKYKESSNNDENEEVESSADIDISRRKRRRSSANIE